MAKAKRPPSIIWFERIYLSMLAAAILSTVLSVKSVMDELDEENPLGAAPLLPFRILTLMIALFLCYAAARRGSSVARGFVAFFAAYSAFVFCVRLAWVPTGADVPSFLAALILVLQVVASRLLFRADADLWFARIRPVDPAIFE